MPLSVDFDFIHTLEGRRVLDGYVPDPDAGGSGVTIASGFDLGQRNPTDLERLGLSNDLCARCRPYLGLKGEEALRALSDEPLSVTDAEAASIDDATARSHLQELAAAFDAASSQPFASLTPEQQTVIASVSFQYGVALWRRTPNFWRQITLGDWAAALMNLRDFGDRYPTRRNREADLLEEATI